MTKVYLFLIIFIAAGYWAKAQGNQPAAFEIKTDTGALQITSQQ
jgi:hypothetical protein